MLPIIKIEELKSRKELKIIAKSQTKLFRKRKKKSFQQV